MRRLKKSSQVEDKPLPPYVSAKPAVREIPGQFAANMKWLDDNWMNYKGMWVALNNGELLAAGAEEQDIMSVVLEHPNHSNITHLLVGRDFRVL